MTIHKVKKILRAYANKSFEELLDRKIYNKLLKVMLEQKNKKYFH